MFWRRLGETRVDDSVPWVLIGQKLSWEPQNSVNLRFESLWKRRVEANSVMDKSKRALTFLKVFSFSCTLLWKSEKILWSSSTDPGCRTWTRKMIRDLHQYTYLHHHLHLASVWNSSPLLTPSPLPPPFLPWSQSLSLKERSDSTEIQNKKEQSFNAAMIIQQY